jgi:hypothetical protein
MRGAHVIAAESYSGPAGRRELAASHAFFGQTPEAARARYEAHRARSLAAQGGGTLGQAPPMVWQEQHALGDGSYAIWQGGRYAVLASVSQNYSLAEIVDFLNAHGWQTTYAWQEGTPGRGQYAIDAWLDSLAPDATGNHRWVYGEGNRTGPNEQLAGRPPWPFTFFSIAHVFRAVAAPPGPTPAPPDLPPPSGQAPPAAGVPTVVVVAGAAAGAAAIAYALWRWVF